MRARVEKVTVLGWNKSNGQYDIPLYTQLKNHGMGHSGDTAGAATSGRGGMYVARWT